MNILIIEDESYSSKMLEVMINELRPEWNILDILEDVESSIEWLSSHPNPDLIFLDIQLSDGISFSIFENVKVDSSIIFTTAFNKYAVQAFDVNSIDYLLKPIRESKLLKAIEKFEHFKKPSQALQTDYSDLIAAIKHGEKRYRTRFLIAGIKNYTKVNVEDIAYFYSKEGVTFAVTFEGREHILNLTIEKLESQLNPENFFRANRSTIISSESINKFENYFNGILNVDLIAPFTQKVSISRLKAKAFKTWLDQ